MAVNANLNKMFETNPIVLVKEPESCSCVNDHQLLIEDSQPEIPWLGVSTARYSLIKCSV